MAYRSQDTLILDGASSPAVAIDRGSASLDLVGVENDAAYDGASYTFKVGNTTGVLPTKILTGVSVTCAASAAAKIDPDAFRGFRYVLPVSSAAQSGADSTPRWHLRTRV